MPSPETVGGGLMELWLDLILSTAGALAAIASAVAAWLVLGIARKQTEPQILVTIEPLVEGSVHHSLTVKNVGASPAFRVVADVDTFRRKLDEPGVWGALKERFPAKWSRIDPGKVKSFLLDVEGLWQERNSEAELVVNVRYSTKSGTRPNRSGSFEITPSWTDGELMRGPGIWREVDARVEPLQKSMNQMNELVKRIADRLDDKDNK